ncbi:MAG: hypothetical protein RR162_05945 [Oscillospiraceae bacterium]
MANYMQNFRRDSLSIIRGQTKEVLLEAKQKLQAIKDEISKFSKSYFWKPSAQSELREQTHFTTTSEVLISGLHIEFNSNYTSTCNHCYYTRNLTLNGVKISARRINTLLEVIDAELAANHGIIVDIPCVDFD